MNSPLEFAKSAFADWTSAFGAKGEITPSTFRSDPPFAPECTMGINHSSLAEGVRASRLGDMGPRPPPDARGSRACVLCIREEAARLKAEILEIGGIEGHVHVLLRMPATVSLADLVKQLKGSSSHLANHEVVPRGFKWQGGYSAFSVSRRALGAVRDYIRRQEQHHRDGTIYATAER